MKMVAKEDSSLSEDIWDTYINKYPIFLLKKKSWIYVHVFIYI